jgi:serine/threonine-protein kinase HipA
MTKDMNEVIKVCKLAVFNLLTHNRDNHAKNFPFLLEMRTTGSFSLLII